MPASKRTRTNGSTNRSVKQRRTTKRITKYTRRRGSARPMRSLSTGYRGVPNSYRFTRETSPVVIDLGITDPDPSTRNPQSGVSVLAAAGTEPTMTYINLPSVRMMDLPNVAEFSSLFNNYHVDKIETFLIPMWQSTDNPNGVGSGPLQIPGLMITRVNTKWLATGLPAAANAAAQRNQLAEIQKKSRSLYGNKKWLKLVTDNPKVQIDVSDGAAGTNIGIYPQPWLQFSTGADQQFESNHTFFADRLDGTSMVSGVYKYRMYHKLHFRTSFLG